MGNDPNSLKIIFHAGKKSSKGLRVPLGYFKLYTMPRGSRLGRQTCAFIMDQAGQCLVTSVAFLAKAAHLDLSQSRFAFKAGGLMAVDGAEDDEREYTNYVDAHFCSPPQGALGK